MTGKSDFTEEEWKTVLEGPTSAGLHVITSDRGGSIRESFSMAKAYADARQQHGDSQLLDEIVSEKPKVDKERPRSAQELKTHGPDNIREAVALVEAKGTPEELEDFRRFVMNLAQRVAEAHREGFLGLSGERVSPEERTAVTEVAEALGTEPPELPDTTDPAA